MRVGRIVRRIVLGLALAVAAVVVAAIASPWPSVMVIRAVFDKGAADAAAALEKRVPAGLLVQRGVRYDPNDPDALLDVYRPASLAADAPTIVWVHGGGFVSGRRGDIENYLKILAGQGFAVVNIDYTIAPEAIYPTPVKQLGRALEYVDRNAAALGINRAKLVLAGDSAGAQIAAQTANLVAVPAYARAVGIAAPIEPAQLKGTLLFCGVYDLGLLGEGKHPILRWFLGTVTWAYSGKRDWSDAPGFELMSVARHVTGAFPPSFISAGNADPLLPQSLLMDQALRAQGVAVDSLFFAQNHQPELAHEYQFDLNGEAGRLAFERTVTWLRSR